MITGNKTNEMLKIQVVNNRIKNNQVTALHLMVGLLFIVLGLVTVMVPSTIKTLKYMYLENIGWLYFLFGIFLIIISIFYNKKVIQTKKNQVLRIIEIIALSIIIVYSIIHEWYLPASYCFAALIGVGFAYLWEKQALKEFNILLSDQGVSVPKIWSNTQIHWKDIKYIILKHNVITIDCKDNKLIQYSINSLYGNEAIKIENYASDQIKNNKHLYQENW